MIEELEKVLSRRNLSEEVRLILEKLISEQKKTNMQFCYKMANNLPDPILIFQKDKSGDFRLAFANHAVNTVTKGFYKQKQGLQFIKTHILEKFGSTGIQKCIEETVSMLDLIVVYPVEDDHHLTDKDGRILPDAFLVPRGSTAKDLAYKIHTDIGDHFIRAIDARSKRVIGADYELKDGDVINIVSNA